MHRIVLAASHKTVSIIVCIRIDKVINYIDTHLIATRYAFLTNRYQVAKRSYGDTSRNRILLHPGVLSRQGTARSKWETFAHAYSLCYIRKSYRCVIWQSMQHQNLVKFATWLTNLLLIYITVMSHMDLWWHLGCVHI